VEPWTATLIAIFIWWFSTGGILFAVRAADRIGGDAHWMATVLGIPLLALGAAAVAFSLPSNDIPGVYAGFLGALAIWGWIELAFLAGVIAGPVRSDCPPGLSGAARFSRAWGTVAHHELLLALAMLALIVATTGAANKTALWTFSILFFARISAKLNLFYGVPRINMEFIPARLNHLKTYFRRGPITPAFPISITLLSFAVACFAERLISSATAAREMEFTLLTALSALALLEHWLMVLPLPDAKLWRWMLPATKDRIADPK
jgi:putative photosynthetic complex assembly protein 2